jgi:hypothetical protein
MDPQEKFMGVCPSKTTQPYSRFNYHLDIVDQVRHFLSVLRTNPSN